MTRYTIYTTFLFSLITCTWASEFTSPASAAVEIVDEHVSGTATGSISAGTIQEITPEGIVEKAGTTEYANSNTIFENVIGLGHACIVKMVINQYFAPVIGRIQTKKGHADLFDWTFIRDYSLIANAIKTQLCDFFLRENLKILDENTGAILEEKYNVRFAHLFDHIFTDYGNNTKKSTLTDEMLDIIYPTIKQKIDHLSAKFISAKSSKILYVMTHFNDDNHTTAKPTLNEIKKVRDTLQVMRDDNKDFLILFISHDDEPHEDIENIIFRKSTLLNSNWDGVDTARWHEILSEFKFTPDIWA